MDATPKGSPEARNSTRAQPPDRGPDSDHGSSSDRFLTLDRYRVEREWIRYEGTAQRALFRELRARFLRRHAAKSGWVLDVGSGPGRFLPYIGAPACRRIALDLSVEMLRRIPGAEGPPVDLVRGDGLRAPFANARFSEVVILGNALGFAGDHGQELLGAAARLVQPKGLLLLEVVAGPGERSRYLARLPPRAAGRLLRSPIRATGPRVESEGFAVEPPRRAHPGSFRRFDPSALGAELADSGWIAREVMAVAPLTGFLPEVLEAAHHDPKAWGHLIELEERVGRAPDRWSSAAAVLAAYVAPGPS